MRVRPTDFEELRALSGTRLGPTPWHLITREWVEAFADMTGDHSWVHVDGCRAKMGPDGGCVVHPLYLLALGPAFLDSMVSFQGYSYERKLGYDNVAFERAIPIGTRVRMFAVLSEVSQSSCLELSVREEFEADNRPGIVCAADLRVRLELP